MAAVDLPSGLSGAWRALSYGHEAHLALRRLTSLVWLRIVTDPAMPKIAGNDPRKLLEMPPVDWSEPVVDGSAELLDSISELVNHDLGCGDLLSSDWQTLPRETVAKAVHELGRWSASGPAGYGFAADPLGEISQRIRSEAAKSGLGEYYTPYNVSLAMATMVGPEPDQRTLDPACGSGRMLLAMLEAFRKAHPRSKRLPQVYGIDISPEAVRLCRLNLALAGVHPANRVECEDFLRMTPAEQLTPPQRALQLELFKFEEPKRAA